MQDSALNVFCLDDPASLELPEHDTLPGGQIPVVPADEGGPGGMSGMLFSSMGFSIATHVLVALLGLSLAASPQLPVQVMSISLLPGMKASGSPQGPPGPPVQGESSAGPEPLPAPPPPEPRVEQKPVEPAPKPEVEKAKPLPRKTEKKPRKEPAAPKEERPEPVAPAVVAADAQSAQNATAQAAVVTGVGMSPIATVSAEPFGGARGGGSTGGGGGLGPINSRFGDADGPRFVQRVMPRYPELARRRGREGVVVLRLIIAASGELKAAEVVEGGGSGFEDAALAAVRSSTYAPATRDGQGVESAALLPIRFTLKGS